MVKSTDSYNRMQNHFDKSTIHGVNIGAKQSRGDIEREDALLLNHSQVLSEEKDFIKEIPGKAGFQEGIAKASTIVKKKGFWN
jgi:hypothetical protein